MLLAGHDRGRCSTGPAAHPVVGLGLLPAAPAFEAEAGVGADPVPVLLELGGAGLPAGDELAADDVAVSVDGPAVVGPHEVGAVDGVVVVPLPAGALPVAAAIAGALAGVEVWPVATPGAPVVGQFALGWAPVVTVMGPSLVTELGRALPLVAPTAGLFTGTGFGLVARRGCLECLVVVVAAPPGTCAAAFVVPTPGVMAEVPRFSISTAVLCGSAVAALRRELVAGAARITARWGAAGRIECWISTAPPAVATAATSNVAT